VSEDSKFFFPSGQPGQFSGGRSDPGITALSAPNALAQAQWRDFFAESALDSDWKRKSSSTLLRARG